MRLLIGKTVAVILLTVGFGIQSAQAQIVASILWNGWRWPGDRLGQAW